MVLLPLLGLILWLVVVAIFYNPPAQDSEQKTISDSHGGKLTYPKGTRSSYQQLLDALQGDKTAATRLISRSKIQYPGYPDQWYQDRCLQQLMRDRQVY